MIKTTKKPPHIKTSIYIVPVGKPEIRPHKDECNCLETKGVDHVSAKSHKA